MHVVMIARASKYRCIYIAKRFNRFPAGAIIRVNIFIGNNCSPIEKKKRTIERMGEKHPSNFRARNIFNITCRTFRYLPTFAMRINSATPRWIRTSSSGAHSALIDLTPRDTLRDLLPLKWESAGRDGTAWETTLGTIRERSENERFWGERRESWGGGSLWSDNQHTLIYALVI